MDTRYKKNTCVFFMECQLREGHRFEIHVFCRLQKQKPGSVFLGTSKLLNRQENKVVNEIRSKEESVTCIVFSSQTGGLGHQVREALRRGVRPIIIVGL